MSTTTLRNRMQTAWRGSSRALAVALTGLLAACATPDIKPFAQETGTIAVAISSEQSATETRLAQLQATLSAMGQDTTRVDGWLDGYTKNAKALDAVLGGVVSYSDQVASLAAAGETGSAAVKSIASSLSGIGSAIGVAMPAADLPAWAATLAQGIGQEVTRVEAQGKLTDALDKADPAIAKIGAAIEALYQTSTPAGAQYEVITALWGKEQTVARDKIGLGQLQFYMIANQRLGAWYQSLAADIANQKNPGICGLTSPSSGSPCLAKETAQSLQLTTQLMAGLKPDYEAYLATLKDSSNWLTNHRAAADEIVAAAKAWVAAHAKLRTTLDRCGGLRVFESGCGTISFTELKSAADQLIASTTAGAK